MRGCLLHLCQTLETNPELKHKRAQNEPYHSSRPWGEGGKEKEERLREGQALLSLKGEQGLGGLYWAVQEAGSARSWPRAGRALKKKKKEKSPTCPGPAELSGSWLRDPPKGSTNE